MKKILLIDADVVAFKFAKVSETKGDLLPDGTRLETTLKPLHLMKHMIDKWYDRIIMNLETPHYISCLSCPSKDLYRYDIRSDYKANRKDKRPDYLPILRDYIFEKHNGQIWKNIEADDVIGLLANRYKADGENPIVCSVDKDLKTLGVKMYDFNEDKYYNLSDYQSLRYFYEQCLTGDRVDNYLGCRGIGKAKVAKILESVDEKFLKCVGVKHFSEVDSEMDLGLDLYERYLWDAVITTYVSKVNTETEKKYTYDDCIEQCRLAYILRNPEDYDRETGEVRLWVDPIFREILYT